MNKSFTLFFLLIALRLFSQDTKTVRGTVIDKDSKFPVIGATILLIGSNPIVGCQTNETGQFELEAVPLGRASFKISFIGYKDAFANDVLIIAGKEAHLTIELEEKVSQITEIVINGNSDKAKAKNEFAVLSARSFDVEQTSRFSGSRNDPARMATNFAGVSGANDARNDIIIRGNAPTGLLWRLEGLDIPSPNHFSSFGSTGGPVSMLNNNTLARSDFMTSAFPAEYSNALAGVFDLKMRSGNKDKYEFLAQLGFNGIEVGAEGPFAKKKSDASFLFNYRYSTLGLFKLLKANFGTGTAVPEYQDLSFKIDLPTKKWGTFRLFGLGGLSKIEILGSKLDLSKPQKNLYGNENQDLYNTTRMGLVGFSYHYFLNTKSFVKLIVGASHQFQKVRIDTVNSIQRTDITAYNKVLLRQNKYAMHLLYNCKINNKNTLVVGTMYDIYDVLFKDSISYQNQFVPLKAAQSMFGLLRTYAMWQHKFTDQLLLNTGADVLHFTLSNNTAPEARISLKYQWKKNQFFSFGYGLHHQIQPLPTYFNYDVTLGANATPTNLKMGFTRSHHLVAGYDVTFKKDFHIKTEVYYQYLDKVPVEQFKSSFSMLNAGADFATPNNTNLINKGIGMNYGLELTAEKFFSKGYYFLGTVSIFQSKYNGSDQKWRNTAFNGLYVMNGLGGYEYKFATKKSKAKRTALTIDSKITVAGGRFYTPIDVINSQKLGTEILIDEQAFTKQYPVYFRWDAKIGIRISLKKITQEFTMDFQNLTNQKNVLRKSYNIRTFEEVTQFQQGIFILPQYKLYF